MLYAMAEITPRARWKAVFEGCGADRPPCDYGATAEVSARLRRDLNCADDRALWKCLGVDRCVHLAPDHPRAVETDWHLQSLFSIWGIVTREIGYGSGVYCEVVSGPLEAAETPADVERFSWPDPEEWELTGIRQQALTDLIDHPAITEATLARIHFIHERLFERIPSEAGDLVDFVYIAEDLGTQESLLMSPALFRRFLRPTLRRMIDMANRHGVRVFRHDDGAIRPLIPDLLDIGIDVLNPIQGRCHGMDRAKLAPDFGSRIVFHGGVDNQQTLPFGSREDVCREVEENITLFSACKGYSVAPCHNIQANTPTANIVALYETVRKRGM